MGTKQHSLNPPNWNFFTVLGKQDAIYIKIIMENNVLYFLIWSLVLVVYLTQLPKWRLDAFGNFLKKVLGVLPITKAIEAIKGKDKKGE